ncbi:hypothetical protein EXIGLDRAFT_7304 [Exidia glandulosa HHB12029]|uniref:Uncharacterized protein n=1 Tax=Exidia glandulosa HHB12029 TaxID=1314781 RepID=A0A165QP95_EXIGL|nr:hypothetical protein EXIGLDRAFT_7304 [Exidia glandulosa HHB12029]
MSERANRKAAMEDLLDRSGSASPSYICMTHALTLPPILTPLQCSKAVDPGHYIYLFGTPEGLHCPSACSFLLSVGDEHSCVSGPAAHATRATNTYACTEQDPRKRHNVTAIHGHRPARAHPVNALAKAKAPAPCLTVAGLRQAEQASSRGTWL